MQDMFMRETENLCMSTHLLNHIIRYLCEMFVYLYVRCSISHNTDSNKYITISDEREQSDQHSRERRGLSV